MKNHVIKISRELSLETGKVAAVISLLEEGATIPFIARYRKEATGSLDEVAIARIKDRAKQLNELEARREFILGSISEQGKLTNELKNKIDSAETLTELEDIYLPYKPKRRTRAMIAKEKGLEPFADWLMLQGNENPEKEALKYFSKEKGVLSATDALDGAKDIIAERIAEDAGARSSIRILFLKRGILKSKLIKGKEEAGAKFRDYFKWEEEVKSAPSHRILALFRGEEEGILNVKIAVDEEDAMFSLERMFLTRKNSCAAIVREAVQDGFKRLLAPSIETETRATLKEKADKEAIEVFAENLRQLLMAAPMGGKNLLAIDPGFRTGCKVVLLDAQGNLLSNDTIYPHPPQNKSAEAEIKIRSFVEQHRVEAIAIGNGTAGRETEDFVRKLELKNIQIIMVNENGASVYSASEIAREEFPDKDITVRGAVSIGRRLMDPLAELVKIDPKAIGVGQYQHDVDQNLLGEKLDEVVMSCVNQVGVELNTASKELLTYVSGLGPTLAGNIIAYRKKSGAFHSREELKKVPRLGEKAFEQCAGFLRIHEAKNPLDGSAVHPESYWIVDKMAKNLGCKVSDLIEKEELRKSIKPEELVSEKIGLPTLKDILNELSKPGRDPREQFEVFEFAEGITSVEDLKVGMILPGIITNVTRFGAFVDIGVHQEGLVHISELADRFVKDPAEVVKVQQKVKVKVLEVDVERKRIGLSMKNLVM